MPAPTRTALEAQLRLELRIWGPRLSTEVRARVGVSPATFNRALANIRGELVTAGATRSLTIGLRRSIPCQTVRTGVCPVTTSSRRSSSSRETPLKERILSREECPTSTAMCAGGMSSASARSRTTAAFARPASGGAATRTFQAEP